MKPHVEKLGSSDITGPNGLKMAKIESFRDISRNVEIRALWFSELRMMVIVALFCGKRYVFEVPISELFTGQEVVSVKTYITIKYLITL